MSAKQIAFERWSKAIDSLLLENRDWSFEDAFEIALTLGTIEILQKNHGISSSVISWLARHGDPLARWILSERNFPRQKRGDFANVLDETRPALADSHTVLMNLVHATQGKLNRGVYYTPNSLARFVVRSATNHLSRCGLSLKDAKIMEPSVGTGVFLSGLLDELVASLQGHEEIHSVLSNVTCLDISPAAIVIAQVLLCSQLNELGLPLDPKTFPRFYAGHTLSATAHKLYKFTSNGQVDLETVTRESTYQLVIGNPPFGTLTDPTDSWSQDLLHGKLPSPAGERSYYEINETKLGEKKSWLHDDYVKFVRFGHWHAERNEVGCIAFVLNSGFLSNLSFRGMRYHLLDTFDNLQVVDLGGDRRNARKLNDENVFGIETGIAVLVASKSASVNDSPKVECTKLSGNRKAKLEWCSKLIDEGNSELGIQSLKIDACDPHYFLDRNVSQSTKEFESGWSLDDLFQSKWSVPVTARDHLVVDWNRERLIHKINCFLDNEKSDAEIRESHFSPPRSNRYPRGNTRSWQMESVRKSIRQHHWQDWIRPCSYRPFDNRFVLWHPSMIDWPRGDLAKTLDLAGNYCLIARRQAPASSNYSYFWSTSHIPLDGIIRSDNRGNEYCYPLFVLLNDQASSNIKPEVIEQLQSYWKVDYLQPDTVFYLIIAVLHSTNYRERFQEPLCMQVPKVFFPKSFELAKKLSEIGKQIVLHQTSKDTVVGLNRKPNKEALKCYSKPRYVNGQLFISAETAIEIPENIWHFQVGSHQVLKKYLTYRVRDSWTVGLVTDLLEMTAKIKRLIQIQNDLDKLIASSGGFGRAFCMKGFGKCSLG